MLEWYYFGYIGLSDVLSKLILPIFYFFNVATRKFEIAYIVPIVFLFYSVCLDGRTAFKGKPIFN